MLGLYKNVNNDIEEYKATIANLMEAFKEIVEQKESVKELANPDMYWDVVSISKQRDREDVSVDTATAEEQLSMLIFEFLLNPNIDPEKYKRYHVSPFLIYKSLGYDQIGWLFDIANPDVYRIFHEDIILSGMSSEKFDKLIILLTAHKAAEYEIRQLGVGENYV